MAAATLRGEHDAALRDLTSLKRNHKRDSEVAKEGSMEYLKNVLLQYCADDENHAKLFPVIATILQFTAPERELVRQARLRNKKGAVGSLLAGWM
jgi:hypothetical protein